MRNYELMRNILLKLSKDCAEDEKSLPLSEMEKWIEDTCCSTTELTAEVERLRDEKLIDCEIVYNKFSRLKEGIIYGVTSKGEEFLRLIENSKVWDICFSTLKEAGLDLSYPFIKEVCEEIVKRYVFSKIPSNI